MNDRMLVAFRFDRSATSISSFILSERRIPCR